MTRLQAEVAQKQAEQARKTDIKEKYLNEDYRLKKTPFKTYFNKPTLEEKDSKKLWVKPICRPLREKKFP